MADDVLGWVKTGDAGAPTREATAGDVADPDTTVYAFPTAFPARKDPHPDSPDPVSVKALDWRERDKSRHSGTEYRFDPATGLPPLRLEWSAQQNGWGLGVLFMATAHPDTGGGPNDYTFDAEGSLPGGDEHPDNEPHYRTTFYEQYALLFPDKTSVSYDAQFNIVPDGTPDAQVVTVADCVDEAIRRYRATLLANHPDPVVQALETMSQLKAEIELTVQLHNELAGDVVAQDPEQTPATLVLETGPPPAPPVPEPTAEPVEEPA